MGLSTPDGKADSQESKNLLELRGLSFAYPGGNLVLSGVSLNMKPGEVLGLSGVNGSGKSTLFRCITGLEKASGEIIFLGKNIASEKDFSFARRHIGFVLQNSDNQIVFPTVLEDVMFGPMNLGLPQKEAHHRAHHWLTALGIGDYGQRIVSNLSGGEKKLVALAGILAMEPELILLDEPMNELDANARKRFMLLLAENPAAKIIASHETHIFSDLGCDVIRLESGILKN